MPNYLTQSSGRPNPASTAGRKGDMFHIDPMYQTRLFNQDRSTDFKGKMPDQFSLDLAGSWGEAFESAWQDATGAVLGRAQRGVELAAQAGGATTRSKMGSARTWEQGTYMEIGLPFSLYAYGDTQEEIIQNLHKLYGLTAPKLTAGMLQSPGPSPIKNMLSESGAAFAKNLSDNLRGEVLTLQIGTFFTMSPVVVTNVNANFDGIMEHGTGNPISVSCEVTVSSYFAVTKDDILEWFHGGA